MPTFNALGIVVRDMAESIRFYRLLGLDVPDTPAEGHIDTTLPNGLRFMLDSEDVQAGYGSLSADAGFAGVRRHREPESGAQRSGASGDEKEPWDAFWGQRYAQLRDPNGVPVDLYAPLG